MTLTTVPTMETTWLNAQDADFDAKLAALTAWSEERDEEVADRVRGILRDVAKRGDAALVEYTNRFDRRDVAGMDALVVGHDQLQAALERIPAEQRQALEAAAERVRRYHEKQKQDSWQYREADGTLLGQQVTPLDRAGIYVPGGKAAYPSSVLMNALPAKVAGVGEIIMVSPAPDGEINDMVLAAAAVDLKAQEKVVLEEKAAAQEVAIIFLINLTIHKCLLAEELVEVVIQVQQAVQEL